MKCPKCGKEHIVTKRTFGEVECICMDCGYRWEY